MARKKDDLKVDKIVHEELNRNPGDDSEKKVLFLQRLIAFVIDVLLVTTIASIVAMPFTMNSQDDKLEQQMEELVEKLNHEEIDVDSYMIEYANVVYKIARNSGLTSIISIVANILYFVVYQIYEKGQTIGKKIMKIRVVSLDGELTMNQMIFRSFLANFILVDLLSLAFMIFGSKYLYFYGVGCISLLQFVITFLSIVMVSFRKDGRAIHDMIVRTKVIYD